MRLDLHLHSTASDGGHPPAAIGGLAARAGLDAVALTDHDTVVGVAAAVESGERHSVRVIPAIELSTTLRGRDLHILGYFIDPEAPSLLRHQERASQLREERIGRMIGRLAKRGVVVEFEAVLRAAGRDRFNLTRPHLAAAIVEAGYAATIPEAFDRYIGDRRPAYIPTRLIDSASGIRLIREAKGIPVWAHPPLAAVDALLPSLLDAGLRGLEAFRPRFGVGGSAALKEKARVHDLLLSGGSDFHGPWREPQLGEFHVTEEEVGALLREGGF